MKLFHNLIVSIVLFTSIFIFLGINEVFASNYINQINLNSTSEKIEKLQNVFKELGLYSGEIDGNFDSIKDELIAYQVENNIIPDENSDEAGYFGDDTFTSLEKVYGKKFEKLKEKYLKYEELEKNEEGYFVVTAYYTPVKGQVKYEKGSYRADIRLNGHGNTASQKTPFAGVFAAPRNYPFGTKIYLEGLGVGVVEDRGGAIVNAGERGHSYDRIDIWTGIGDDGRQRAIKWGKRTVKGYIVDNSLDVSIEFNELKVAKYAGLKVDAESPKIENVKKLQELFREVGFYSGEINGKYNDIKDILIKFQKENGIKSYFGYFGNKTYSALLKNFPKQKTGLFIKKEAPKIEKKEEIKKVNLTLKEKKEVEYVKNEILKILRKKYKEEELEKVIITLKEKIKKIISETKKEEIKHKFNYLIEIL